MTTKEVNFSEVEVGDSFTVGGRDYTKTEELYFGDTGHGLNCIDGRGKRFYVYPGSIVTLKIFGQAKGKPARLFDENDEWTEKARQVDIEANEALSPLFQKLVEQGYSPREIAHIVHFSVTELELIHVIPKV